MRLSSQSSKRQLRQSRGVTLTELLVAMALISFLAGITIMGLNRSREKQSIALAKSQLSILAGGLEQFRAEFGRYPYNHNGSADFTEGQEGLPSLFNEGFILAEARGARSFNLSYREEGPQNNLVWRVFRVLDPWMTAYYYNGPSQGNAHEDSHYQLYSYGPYGVTPPVGSDAETLRIYPE